ncbi:MAG: PfkB family carbohydrate kinase [Thermoproteota archaeon]
MPNVPLKIGVVGALTIDVNRSRGGVYRYVGGGGFYSSASLSRIGVETVLFTAYGSDMDPEWVERLRRMRVTIHREELEESIVFENFYEDSLRLQKSYGEPARKIHHSSQQFSGFDAVHVTPVLNEVDYRVFEELAKAGCKVSIDAQGFVRRVGEDGYVHNVKRMLSEDALKSVNYVHMNFEEQMFFLNRDVKELFDINPSMVVEITNSEHGSIVMDKHRCFYIPALEARALDPTGAGDVYAAVFLAKHAESRDLLESGLYASACASIKVEKTGPVFDFSLSEVKHRVELLRKIFETLY